MWDIFAHDRIGWFHGYSLIAGGGKEDDEWDGNFKIKASSQSRILSQNQYFLFKQRKS